MIENNDFTREGRAVVHCDALRARRLPETEQQCVLSALAQRLAGPVMSAIRALGNEDEIGLEMSAPSTASLPDYAQAMGCPAAHFIFPLVRGGEMVLAGFTALPLVHQLDRLLGGAGVAQEDLSDGPLPPSLELLAADLGKAAGQGLSQALGAALGSAYPQLESDLLKAKVFREADELRFVELRFSCGEMPPIVMRLACRLGLLPRLQLTQIASAEADDHAAATVRAPFTEIPLRLDARLVDMRVSARKIAILQLGDILPVPIARQVPLTIANNQVALGTVGESDDRIALQITQNLLSGDTP